jgi:hypothetical protein
MRKAQILSTSIQDEADKLLAFTKLFELLGKFGEVDLGGSYKYGLMVDRDLDFGVLIKEMNPEIRSEIAKLFAVQSWTYGMTINDRINFNPLSNFHAPLGLFLGLTIPFMEKSWNIDTWFVVQKGFEDDEITKLVKSASNMQRDIILEIKYEMLQRGLKQKGVTSAEVYKAVLLDGVNNVNQFLYIKNN